MTTAALLSCLALLAPSGDSTWRAYETPEQAGFSSELLGAAWELADRIDSAAVFVVYRGQVLLAWGQVERRMECHSVRKSLMNALVGRAVDAQRIDPTATLAALGIDDREPLSDTEKSARVLDLLAARSGVYHPAAKEPADMRAERPARGSHAPGESFFYNNWDFNLPGALLERATGKSVAELFEEGIARPLGMEDFRRRDVCPQLEPSRSLHPAHAFRMSARDLARFGLLYLQKGAWQGQTILPASWVAESTREHTALGDGRGYGLLWWTYAAGSLASYPALNRHDLFAAIGSGGQLILVAPAAELVLVHRGDSENGREVRGRDVWALAESILAARQGDPEPSPRLVPLHVEPLPDPGVPFPDREAVRLEPAQLAHLAGEYSFADGSSARVFVHEGRLFVHRNDGEEAELYPLSDSRFFLWVDPMEIEFQRDDTGHARAVTIVTARGNLTGTRR